MYINLLAIIVCAIVAMIIGALWYGPLFGKAWGRLLKVDMSDPVKCAEMKKKAMPLYALQFVLVFIQIFILATFSQTISPFIAVINSVWIWLGFVMPTTAAACMWGNDTRKEAWTKFGIQAGYQLVLFIVFGAILGLWQ